MPARRPHCATRPVPTLGALLLSLLLPACGPPGAESSGPPEVPEIVVGGLDYTFDLPAELPAGPVQFAFDNRGEVPHEMVLFELEPGTTVSDMADAMQSGEDPRAMVRRIGGILIADPGDRAWGRIHVDLEAGSTYGLICNFVDAEGDPPHLALGMLRTFTVSGSETSSEEAP
jgi:hypothetical protein